MMDKYKKISLILSILIFLVFIYLFRDYSIDDAFITFRYAENLVEGHGLVFNPGGKPVEAYSNFLWLPVLAVGYYLGLPTYLSAKVLGVLFFLLTGIVWFQYAQKGQKKYTWLTGPLFLLTPIAAFWAVSGLELGLYSLLLVTYSLSVLKKSGWAFILGMLIVLVRLEGFGIALVILLAGWIADHRNGENTGKYYIINAVTLLIALAGLIGLRMVVFGYPMPNTFYMKLVAARHGLFQLIKGLLYFLPITLLFLWGLYGIITRKKFNKAIFIFSTAFITQAAITCAADAVMNFHLRYIIPFVPFLIFVALTALAEIKKENLARIILVLVGVSLLTPIWNVYATIELERKIIVAQTEIIKYINTIPEHLTISLTDIGRIPYYTEATCYDLWGLASEEIAHGKSNALIEYLRFPDYFILVGYIEDNRLIPRFGSDGLIVQNRGFKQAYELAFISKLAGAKLTDPGYYYFAFKKNQKAVDSLRQYLPEK